MFLPAIITAFLLSVHGTVGYFFRDLFYTRKSKSKSNDFDSKSHKKVKYIRKRHRKRKINKKKAILTQNK